MSLTSSALRCTTGTQQFSSIQLVCFLRFLTPVKMVTLPVVVVSAQDRNWRDRNLSSDTRHWRTVVAERYRASSLVYRTFFLWHNSDTSTLTSSHSENIVAWQKTFVKWHVDNVYTITQIRICITLNSLTIRFFLGLMAVYVTVARDIWPINLRTKCTQFLAKLRFWLPFSQTVHSLSPWTSHHVCGEGLPSLNERGINDSHGIFVFCFSQFESLKEVILKLI